MSGRARFRLLTGVGLAAAALALVSHATGLLARPERTIIDARFSIRGPKRPPRSIVLVAIDQDSLARLPRFPFPRTLYVPAIQRLRADGARVLAFDIEFNRPTSPGADEALIEAASRARPVVFATSLIDQLGNTEVLDGPTVQHQIGNEGVPSEPAASAVTSLVQAAPSSPPGGGRVEAVELVAGPAECSVAPRGLSRPQWSAPLSKRLRSAEPCLSNSLVPMASRR